MQSPKRPSEPHAPVPRKVGESTIVDGADQKPSAATADHGADQAADRTPVPSGATTDSSFPSAGSASTPASASPPAPLPDEPPFDENDQTVISANRPSLGSSVPLEHIPTGLHSSDLGQLLVGQRLDDLWLEEFVGGGGMGAVFRALDTRLNRNVAVKVLSTYQAGDAETARRFQVEAQSAARLDHPNIARVHYVGEDRGVPYIVFEYIEGTNLRDAVYRGGPLSLVEAIQFTMQIADALLHAWQRDVVHRDIKPSNILITPDNQAKLVDMGLARLHHVDQTDHDLTASGMTLGTFDYIAPEQARNPKDADTRSDIYSLGCTLFFMLTGQPPFSGGTALQKLLQHQGEAPPSVARFRDDIPDSVTEILQTMLAKRIEDRFQNPAELMAALSVIADQLGIRLGTVNLSAAFAVRSPSYSTFARHAPWAIPVLLLVFGVLAIEYFLPARQPPPWMEQQESSQSDSLLPPPDRPFSPDDNIGKDFSDPIQ